MPNAVNAGERERGQCHVPRPDTWRAGMADGGTGAGGEERSTVSIRTSCRINDQTRATVRQCRHGAKAMSADNVTYQDLARRTGELADGGTGMGGEKRSTVSVGFGSTDE